MTHPSKRELSARVESLSDSGEDEPLEVRITDHPVMTRDQAKREGREILGLANETPSESDCVRVADPRSNSTVIRVEP